MTRLSIFSTAFGLIVWAMIAQPAAAGKLDCSKVAGDYSGTMSGKFNGPTRMSLGPACKLKWKLPDGRTNNCRYIGRKGQIEYKCSLGSHGLVTFDGRGITMRNVFTAKRHGAYEVKVKR